MKWYQTLATWIVAIVLSFGAGFLTCWLVKNCSKDIIEVDLTESQKQQIIQDARLGWITLDSAKALIVSESKIKWIPTPKYYDSLRIKDSLNIKDSINYIPVYVARDTTIHFNEVTDDYEVSLAVRLKQRFFPLQERFASDLKLMSLSVEVPQQMPVTDSFWKNRFVFYAGLGINYNDNTFTQGIQLGFGIRIY